jgi:hypothetical protein
LGLGIQATHWRITALLLRFLSLSLFLCVSLSHSSSSLSLFVFLFLVLFRCVLTRALHTHSRHALVAFSISLCLLRLNQVPFCCSSRASKLSAPGRGRDCYTTDFTNFASDVQVKLLSLPPPPCKVPFVSFICNISGSCSV